MAKTTKPKPKKSVETLVHDEASRRNIPTAEYQSVMRAEDRSPIAELVRRELKVHLTYESPEECRGHANRATHAGLHRRALRAARQALFAMRAKDEIGDDAFHRIEEELDWLEMASARDGE